MTKGKGKLPGFGGLGKHLKSVAHRERSQPSARRKFGALEKHKDYVKRSQRRKEVQKRLKEIKRSVAQRNPDEFNVKMTQQEVDVETGKLKPKPNRVVRRTEQQKTIVEGARDVQYLLRRAEADRRRVDELLGEVAFLDCEPRGTHTVFVDNEDEVAAFDPVKYFDTTPKMLHRPALRPRKSVLVTIPVREEELPALTAKHHKARRGVKEPAKEAQPDVEDPTREASDPVQAGPLETRRDAARKYREIAERTKRERNLRVLAGVVVRRNERLSKGLHGRELAKYKKGGCCAQTMTSRRIFVTIRTILNPERANTRGAAHVRRAEKSVW